MSRITQDLATRGPGGRNAAVYAAGLKAGSLLGAARATPGAEHAAWTDEQAGQALLDAAQRNGYTSKDGEAEALRAIRSGLRNGLRAPRTLPDFTAHRAAPDQQPRPQATAGPAWRPPASQARGRSAVAPGRAGRRWQDTVPDAVRREVEAADKAAAARRRAAISAHQQAIELHDRAATVATAAEIERTRAEAHAAHQEYVQDGRHVTGRHDAAMLRWAASITAQREQPAAEPAPEPADGTRERADAANQAYQAGDLAQAQEHTDQAAEIDPSRADLWQQYRDQITARRAVLAARQAYQETGDRQRAEQLLEQARQIDPPTRGRALWDTGLPTPPARRTQRQAGQHSPARQRQRQTASGKQPSKVRSRRQAVKRAQIPRTCRRHGQPANIQLPSGGPHEPATPHHRRGNPSRPPTRTCRRFHANATIPR